MIKPRFCFALLFDTVAIILLFFDCFNKGVTGHGVNSNNKGTKMDLCVILLLEN